MNDRRQNRGIEVGQRFQDHNGGRVRVIAVAEGFAMLRRPGSNPFIQSCRALAKGLRGWKPSVEEQQG